MNPFAWMVRVRTENERALMVHARNHAFPVGDTLCFRPIDDLPTALERMRGVLPADQLRTFLTLVHRHRISLDALDFATICPLNNPLVYVGVIGEEGDPGIAWIDRFTRR